MDNKYEHMFGVMQDAKDVDGHIKKAIDKANRDNKKIVSTSIAAQGGNIIVVTILGPS